MDGAHAGVGQFRKYTGEPYGYHCIEVYSLYAAHAENEEAVAMACLLHDVIEDTKITAADLQIRFGSEVTLLVTEVTDVFTGPEHGNRAERKAKECARLAGISGRAQSIKLADLISNTRSIAKHDPKFAITYVAEKEALLKVLTRGHPKLIALAQETLNAAKAQLGIK